MKPWRTLILGVLLAGGAAIAATPATSVPTATPASMARPVQRHADHCERLAKNKGLTGDDEAKFVKECKQSKEGKKPG